MTTIEKSILLITVVLTVTIAFTTWRTLKQIDDAGGVKNIIVTVGKEIKDISKQIDKD